MTNILINLDYQSRIPIYEQIVGSIEKYVALGILKEKEQIPSIREMASSIGVNPNTVKKSYDILESRGIIRTISTKGTFISENTKKTTEDKINKYICGQKRHRLLPAPFNAILVNDAAFCILIKDVDTVSIDSEVTNHANL